MNPTILGVIGPGFLNQVPRLVTLGRVGFRALCFWGSGLRGFRVLGDPTIRESMGHEQ